MSAARCCAHGRTVASRSDNPCPIGLPGCEASKPEGLVERIERVRTLYLAVMVELNEALVAACAGFHIPRQHRDGKPPYTRVTPPVECDNYLPPLTCLTAPSSESGRCDKCAERGQADA